MLSILMPAYNETQGLKRTVQETVATLEQCGLEYEVLIVNDGSTDSTYEEALSLAAQNPKVKALGYNENKGRGYALKHGFQFAQGDLVLLLDADSDFPPSQIPRLLQYMRENNADVVSGSKRHPQSELNYPLDRRFLSWGYQILTKALFWMPLEDTLTGLKLFKHEVLRQVFPKAMADGFALNLELLLCAYKLGYSIVEAPIEIKYQSASHVNLRSAWRIFLDTMAIFYRMRILHYYDSEVAITSR